MNQLQIRHLMKNGAAYSKFCATGKLPSTFTPKSPLIDLLERINPHERLRLRGLTVNAELGYTGSRQFQNAQQALTWCKPANEVLESASCPAESWRIKVFRQTLSVEQLLAHCTSVPDQLRQELLRRIK